MPLPDGRTPCHPDYAKYLDRGISMHRDDAADILAYVGKNSPAGNYAQDIPPFILGRAIRRLVFVYITKQNDDPDHYVLEQDDETIAREFLAGFHGHSL